MKGYPEIEQAIAAAERATGLSLCIKLFDRERKRLSMAGVPAESHIIHKTPFCLDVKGAHNPRCIECDLRQVPLRCERERASFVNLCHAGANELVFPLFLENRLAAILFLGQFRRTKGQPASLPLFTPAQIRQAQGVGRLLAAYIGELLRTPRFPGKPVHNERAERIRTFLSAQLSQNPDLPALAAHLGLSATRAAHVVVETTGHSFTALRDELRLERARSLLETTYYKITQVAQECGFTSPQYFHRFYRRQTGETPAAWRQRYRMEG